LGFGQAPDIGLVEVDAVRQDHIVANQTVAVEKLDITQSTQGADLIDFVTVFSGVGLQQPSLCSGESGAASQEPW
jgi:hypothetical protein